METNTKMFLFARWISMCYADARNSNLDGISASVLNTEDGVWWRKQLKHFNEVVYPEQIKNGSVGETKEFLKPLDI